MTFLFYSRIVGIIRVVRNSVKLTVIYPRSEPLPSIYGLSFRSRVIRVMIIVIWHNEKVWHVIMGLVLIFDCRLIRGTFQGMFI